MSHSFCVVCGKEIEQGHARFLLPYGPSHIGCKSGYGSSGLGGTRPNSLSFYSPEAISAYRLWTGRGRTPELEVQWHGQASECKGRHDHDHGCEGAHGRRPGEPIVSVAAMTRPDGGEDLLRAQAKMWMRRYQKPHTPHHTGTGTRVGAIELSQDEKFLDPRIACGGEFFSPDPVDASGAVNQKASIGYLLKTPNNAKARIAAIRKKVNDFKRDDVKPGRGVKMISDLSVENLQAMSKELYLKYQEVLNESTDPKVVEDFAKKMGKSVPEVMQEAPDIIKSYTGFDVRQLGEIGKEIWETVGTLIIKELKEAAKAFEETAKAASDAASGMADAASAVPIMGAMFSAGVKMFIEANKEADERYQTQCKDYMDTQITAPMKKTMEKGLPFPWHALEWSMECRTRGGALDVRRWTPTPDQEAIARSFKMNMQRWNAIGDISLLAEAGHWWTLATQLMGVKEIEPIFAALGNNADGAGLLASDEQVMLVAAPIAISYGIPIDDLAEKLWEKSAGWRAGGPSLKPEPISHYHYNDDGDLVGDPSTCTQEAANALQVQWGVLARDAFALAEQVKKTKKVEAAKAKAVVETTKTANVPALLGGVATGALALYGAPIFLAALPLAIGYLLTRRAKMSLEQGQDQTPGPLKGASKLKDAKGTAMTLAPTRDIMRLR